MQLLETYSISKSISKFLFPQVETDMKRNNSFFSGIQATKNIMQTHPELNEWSKAKSV